MRSTRAERSLELDREGARQGPAHPVVGERRPEQRVRQEARAASALSHPSILAVYDVEIEAGTPYIVSELVEGDSLRRVLERAAPLPTGTLLDVAVQIADGLAAAHQAGIVHRDLKPENVMLTRDGRAKILDFGLAARTLPDGLSASKAAATPTAAHTILAPPPT